MVKRKEVKSGWPMDRRIIYRQPQITWQRKSRSGKIHLGASQSSGLLALLQAKEREYDEASESTRTRWWVADKKCMLKADHLGYLLVWPVHHCHTLDCYYGVDKSRVPSVQGWDIDDKDYSLAMMTSWWEWILLVTRSTSMIALPVLVCLRKRRQDEMHVQSDWKKIE